MNTNLISLVSAFTGLAGVIVAGLSLCFSYKERTKNLRELLFDKQTKIISDLTLSITKLYKLLFNFLDELLPTSNEKTDITKLPNFIAAKIERGFNYEPNLTKIRNTYEEFFNNEYKAWFIFLPKKIIISINDFINTYDYIISNLTEITSFPTYGDPFLKFKKLKYIPKYKRILTEKYNKVLGSFRDTLGIEKLSEEIESLIERKTK